MPRPAREAKKISGKEYDKDVIDKLNSAHDESQRSMEFRRSAEERENSAKESLRLYEEVLELILNAPGKSKYFPLRRRKPSEEVELQRVIGWIRNRIKALSPQRGREMDREMELKKQEEEAKAEAAVAKEDNKLGQQQREEARQKEARRLAESEGAGGGKRRKSKRRKSKKRKSKRKSKRRKSRRR